MKIESNEALQFSPIYQNVSLASQSEGDYFTRYGPFQNISKAILKVELDHTGGADHDGVAAYIEGALVADGNRHISFIIMPGQRYHFIVKDFANISVYTTNNRLSSSDVGLPSENDFRNPIGTFHHCASVRSEYGGDDIFSDNDYIYYYLEGSFSDGSYKINQDKNGLSVGPKPAFDVVCKKFSAQ